MRIARIHTINDDSRAQPKQRTSVPQAQSDIHIRVPYIFETRSVRILRWKGYREKTRSAVVYVDVFYLSARVYVLGCRRSARSSRSFYPLGSRLRCHLGSTSHHKQKECSGYKTRGCLQMNKETDEQEWGSSVSQKKNICVIVIKLVSHAAVGRLWNRHARLFQSN